MLFLPYALTFFLVFSASIALAGKGGKHGKPTPSPTPAPPQVTLAWDSDPGAIGFHLWEGFAPGAEHQSIDVGNVLAWTVQLSSGTTYYFVVTAYNSGGESLPSNEVRYTAP